MTDRPSEVLCRDCGLPVPVKPSGRVPLRHPGGCPTGAPAEQDAPVEIDDTGVGAVALQTFAPPAWRTQISPYRWMLPSGVVVDGEGNPA